MYAFSVDFKPTAFQLVEPGEGLRGTGYIFYATLPILRKCTQRSGGTCVPLLFVYLFCSIGEVEEEQIILSPPRELSCTRLSIKTHKSTHLVNLINCCAYKLRTTLLNLQWGWPVFNIRRIGIGVRCFVRARTSTQQWNQTAFTYFLCVVLCFFY